MRRQDGAPPGRVRVIGGRLRGSRIDVSGGDGLRPTPDRVRETLFNWLQPVIEGARCLDLFAGTGALGIEALSRGASDVVFVEKSARLAAALRANLVRLHQDGVATVRCAGALDVLAEAPGRPVDIVFLDPPFDAGLWDGVLAALENSAWLAPAAWIHVEAPPEVSLRAPPGWRPHREGRAGQVRHVLYRRDGSDPLS